MPNKFIKLSTHIALLVASAVAAAPIVGVVLIALDRPGSAVSGVGVPSNVSIDNLQQTWQQGDFAAALAWSAVIATATVLITVVTAVPAGYAFATIRFPLRTPLLLMFVFGLLLPYAGILIPLYYEVRAMKLVGTVWAVVLPSAALSLAFGVFWMRGVFLSLPKELVNAAQVDGASPTKVLTRVAIPLVRSAVLVLVLLTFMWTWNSFMLPLVMLAGSSIQTATLSMASFQGGHVDDVPGLAAAALFVSFPIMLLYVLTQRHFIRGITEGGLKG